MPEKVLPGPIHGNPPCIREAVCIHTSRIYDSCRDKECIENIKIYPTRSSQELIDCATSIRAHEAKLLWTNIDVREVSFNRGFYAVDIKFFYLITAEVCSCSGRSQKVCGLGVYDKRVILYGSEGDVRIFNSKMNTGKDSCRAATNMPTAYCEAVDPIFLGIKLVENPKKCACPSDCDCGDCDILCDVPDCVKNMFDDELVTGESCKSICVTLGQFSIIRLERDSQLLIPAYDFCMPEKECVGSSEDSPCDLFRKIKFPVSEFFPPAARGHEDNSCEKTQKGCCGK